MNTFIQKNYIRDKRSPKPSSVLASKVMSSIHGKDTKPEMVIRKLLWQNDLKGYRVHWKKVFGRPDIAYPSKKLAIFINGCFWHRCPKCDLPIPKSNREFWENKFVNNIIRDSMKINRLEQLGWDVLVFWECDILSEPKVLINKVREKLSKS